MSRQYACSVELVGFSPKCVSILMHSFPSYMAAGITNELQPKTTRLMDCSVLLDLFGTVLFDRATRALLLVSILGELT